MAKGASFFGRNRITEKESHQGRRVPFLLYRARDIDAGGARLQSAPESAVRRSTGDGGRLRVLIEGRDLALVTGQPAEFRFFSSEVRSGDTPGQIIPDAERDLLEISLLEVDLAAVEDIPAGQPVPVQINAVVTELGNLELWMKHTKSDRRWKVEFQVRTE